MDSFDPDKQFAKAQKLVKVWLFRWIPDWRKATPLFEKAAVGFEVQEKLHEAMTAYEKASIGQEKLSCHRDAAELKEAAADAAKQLGLLDKILGFYMESSVLYIKCNAPKLSANALLKAAHAVEVTAPAVAFGLHFDAASIFEEHGEGSMAFNHYQRAAYGYITLEKYKEAAAIFVRSGRASAQSNDTNSQNKAYLTAIIAYLYADDFNEAEKCFNDCSKVATFQNSYQNHSASKLLSFYKKGAVEEIKLLAGTISNLDPVIIKLAKELPTGDVRALKTNAAADKESVDDDDLT